MNPLPAPALTSTSVSIADCFTKPLPISTHHRHCRLVIGDLTAPLSASANTTATFAPAPTVVSAAAPAASDSIPLLHPNSTLAPTLPIVLDAGASYSLTPFASDFLPVTKAPCRLFRSPIPAVSNSIASDIGIDPLRLLFPFLTSLLQQSFPM